METKNSFYEKIIELIPSESLKRAIRDTGYRLSDLTLLSTLFYCAPDFDSRVEYLRLAREHFEGEVGEYAGRLLRAETDKHDAYFKDDPLAVFELHIKETPDSFGETYLCDSFDSAMKMIPLFYGEYGGEESDSTRYSVVKRRVFSNAPGRAFSEDYLGRADLLPGMILYSVDSCRHDAAEECSHLCFECDGICLCCGDVRYPLFTEDCDAVWYRGFDGAMHFGVVRVWDDAPANECYVIPLDSEWIRHHDFENVTYAHQHIPCPYVEKLAPDQLPEGMRDDYYAYMDWCRQTKHAEEFIS